MTVESTEPDVVYENPPCPRCCDDCADVRSTQPFCRYCAAHHRPVL